MHLSISCVLFQFEYQQAQLEAEIENLSWKVERAETTDRGDLENQMDIAEKRRTTLLKDFLEVWQSIPTYPEKEEDVYVPRCNQFRRINFSDINCARISLKWNNFVS